MKLKSFIFCFCLYLYSAYSFAENNTGACEAPSDSLTNLIPNLKIDVAESMPENTLIGEYPLVKSFPINCISDIESLVYWYSDASVSEPQPLPVRNSNLKGIGYKLKVTERSPNGTIGPSDLSTAGYKKDGESWKGAVTVDITLELHRTTGKIDSGEVKAENNQPFGVIFGYSPKPKEYTKITEKNLPIGITIQSMNSEKSCNISPDPAPVDFKTMSYQDLSNKVQEVKLNIACLEQDGFASKTPVDMSLTFTAQSGVAPSYPNDVLKSSSNNVGFKIMFSDKNDNYYFNNGNEIIFNKPISLTLLSNNNGSYSLDFIVKPMLLPVPNPDNLPGEVTASLGITLTYY
jgi:type 1 fimbria pilin